MGDASPGGISASLASSAALWVLLTMFSLSALEKSLSLRGHSAQWHPILLVSARRRRFAVALMVAALVADALIIATLLTSPALAAIVGIPIVIAYTFASFGASHDGSTCRCFWKVLNSSTLAGLVTRNTVLVGLFLHVAFNAPLASGATAPLALSLLAVLWGVMRSVDWLATSISSSQTSGVRFSQDQS